MGLKIDQNDLKIKSNKAIQFIKQGHKVKVSFRFRGREMAHPEVGFALAGKFFELISEFAIIDQSPNMSGREITSVYTRKK